jgi:hypothetical protein
MVNGTQIVMILIVVMMYLSFDPDHHNNPDNLRSVKISRSETGCYFFPPLSQINWNSVRRFFARASSSALLS